MKKQLNQEINVDNTERYLYNNDNIPKWTLDDYLKYQSIFHPEDKIEDEKKLNKDIRVEEESEKYKVNNEHDKVFRTILDDKKEAVSFINKVLKVELREDEIEKYKENYITENLINKETDIVYKLKNKRAFILIEHQTKIDYSMPYRIMEYQYSGEELGRYEIVDVNDYTEEELLKEKTFLSKAMLIERKSDSNNIVESLDKIIDIVNKEKYSKEQRKLLTVMLDIILRTKIDNDQETNRLIEKIKRGGEGNMLALVDNIKRENRRLINQGRREGRKQGEKAKQIEIAKKMKENNYQIDQIVILTGLQKKEIEKL